MSVRFVDANVFLYAYLKPIRRLKEHEVKLKESAKKIVQRINEGEKVLMTVVHFSEVANILEDIAPLNVALEIEEAILLKKNIIVKGISRDDYLDAIDIARNYGVGLNDALAYSVMKKHEIMEIYSFDKDFDKIPGIKRITQ